MATNQFLYFLLLMRDILPQLAMVSRLFQGKTCDLVEALAALNRLYIYLETLKTTPGPHLSKFEEAGSQCSLGLALPLQMPVCTPI